MHLTVSLNTEGLVEAMKAPEGLKLAMREGTAELLAQKSASASSMLFGNYIDAQAAANPKRFWHLYRANEVGVSASRLFEASVGRSKEVGTLGGRVMSTAEVNLRLLPNPEDLTNNPSGSYSGRERQGVKLPGGNSSLGIRTGKRFKSRQGEKRYKDLRNPNKPYKWPSQASDVEFGRKIYIKPKGSSPKGGGKKGSTQRGGWLAIATRRMGVVFAKNRIIDYSTWDSFGAFSTSAAIYFDDSLELKVRNMVQGLVDKNANKFEKNLQEYIQKRAGADRARQAQLLRKVKTNRLNTTASVNVSLPRNTNPNRTLAKKFRVILDKAIVERFGSDDFI